MQYLLDTDTCVDVLRGVAAPTQKLASLTPADCGISTVTSFELFAGAAKSRNPRGEATKVEKLLEAIEELPFDWDIARRAGKLRAELERAGRPLGPYDLLIAAHALVLDLTLVSANRAEFAQVPNLSLENWR